MHTVVNIFFIFQIKRDGQRAYYIDGRDESSANWLRFVNCACFEAQQNLVAYQYKGHIYYRTFKHVYPMSELLVWYGEEYATDLGIAVHDEELGEYNNDTTPTA